MMAKDCSTHSSHANKSREELIQALDQAQSRLDDLEARYRDTARELAALKAEKQDMPSNKGSDLQTAYRTKILESINRIFRQALACKTEEELGRFCLTVAEQLTSSRFSFMGKTGKDGCLEDVAISRPGRTWCRIVDAAGHRIVPTDLPVHGIYGRVLRDGKGFYTNDPAGHPDRIGTPEGHPPLKAFLGVPLLHGGRIIGMVAVANRDGGYGDAELEALQMVAPAMAQALGYKQIDAALRENQSRLEAVLAAIPYTLIEYDGHLKAVRANPAALNFTGFTALGFSRDQLVTGLKFRHLDGTDIVPENLPTSRALRGETVHGDDYRITTPDGIERVISSHVVPLNKEGGISGAVGLWNDVTERHQAEDALAKAKDQLEQTLGSITEGYYALDDQWRFVALNAAAEKYFGCKAEALIGRNIWQVAQAPAESKIFQTFHQVVASGQAHHLEVPSDIRPGFWAEMHLYPGDGILEVYFRDISDRKKAEAALRRSEERFRKIFENAALGIAITDLEGRYQQLNPAYCALVGYTEAELRGIGFDAVVYPDDRQENLAQNRRLREGQVPFFEIENRYLRKDGQSVWVHKFVSILRDDQGRPAHHLALVNDITKARQAKAELAALNQALVERTNLAEQRAADIRQLAMDLSNAEEHERQRIATLLHDDQQQMLAYIKFKIASLKAGDQFEQDIAKLKHLVDDCIGRCRNLAHELKPFMARHQDFFKSLQGLCRQMKEMHGLDVDLEKTAPISITSPVLSNMLIRCVRELLLNVVKYSGGNCASLTARAQGDRIQIAVKDSGKGCDPRKIKEKQNYGLAFGLFDIKDRVKFLGGCLDIQSSPGQGFAAQISVPVDLPPNSNSRSAMVSPVDPFRPQAPSAAVPASGSKDAIKILVVDDHGLMRECL